MSNTPRSWVSTPLFWGMIFCGKVVKTATVSASDKSSFQIDDVVAGYTPTGVGRGSKYGGAHQRYLVCPEDMAFKVPGSMPLHHAACVSVVAMTAADALYNLFGIPLPSGSPDKVAGPLLIWGASSSVGLCAVQFARMSGVSSILVTASAQRHPLLLELGATRCFDYKSPTVISEIKTALCENQLELNHAFDTVGSSNSAKLTADCASPDTTLVSVVVQADTRFKMSFATPNQEVTIKPLGAPGPVTIPARPTDYQRAREAFLWAVEVYGARARFEMPVVEELGALADFVGVCGKVVLRHPLR